MAAKIDRKTLHPVHAIKIENGKAVINEECVGCGICVYECPDEAIILPT